MIDLFTNPLSISHILLVYAFVISVGMALGGVKFFGISLGVIFVLFVGIAANYFGASVDPQVLAFVRDFGMMLFMYFIGLEVGPSFFSSLKTGGIRLNLFMLAGVLLSIAVALCVFFAFQNYISLPEVIGSYFGGVTNTPGLGAAQEVLNFFHYHGKDITIAYACGYPIGFIALLLCIIFLKWYFKVDVVEEDRKWSLGSAKEEPVWFNVEVSNPGVEGKTIRTIRHTVSMAFIASRLKRDGKITSPLPNTELKMGDILMIVSEERLKEGIVAFFGKEAPHEDLSGVYDVPLVQQTVVLTRPEKIGVKVSSLHLAKYDGVNITRIYRSGLQLFPYQNMRLQFGDRLLCVGKQDAINRLADHLGNQVKQLTPSLACIFAGIFIGIIFGTIPFSIPGLPVGLKLGVSGGPLIIGILMGHFGPSLHMNTYVPSSAGSLLQTIGMSLFLASVGLNAGERFVEAVISGEAGVYMAIAFFVAMIPLLTIGIVARKIFNMNFHAITGLLSGIATNTPMLSYASTLSEKNSPAVSYTTVYPLAVFVRILSGQVILIALWNFVA